MTTFLAAAAGLFLGLVWGIATVLAHACVAGMALWMGWNYGVIMVVNSAPYAPYWACVAIAVAFMFLRGTPTASARVKAAK